MSKRAFHVTACWDDEAKVWYVDETDVPGLATEAPTVEKLIERIMAVFPELIAANRHLINDAHDVDLPLSVMAKRLERVRVSA